MKVMAAPSLDKELYKYWSSLTMFQKESVINVIKSFVDPKEVIERISIEEYNKEIDEAMARVEKGEFFTQEEVEKMSREW
jgi:predicted transcriptional regulator